MGLYWFVGVWENNFEFWVGLLVEVGQFSVEISLTPYSSIDA